MKALLALRTGVASSLLFSVAALAQQANYPLPNATMQAGVDKDTSRHFGDAPANPGPLVSDLSPALTPQAIDKAIRKVADWQLDRATPYFDRIWTWSALYSGFMSASEATGDAKYREAMGAMSAKFNYELRNRLPNADDQSIAQTYLELYLLGGKKPDDKKMIAPSQADLDSVIGLATLKPGDPRIPWWWCDALFMAPPVWARMYAATGDHKYIDYLNAQWVRTSEALYDKEEHLYARDATYIPKRAPNGQKVFWSRGEGWVLGGLVRTLQYLPKDDPHRSFYIQQLRDMSARLAELQGTDGQWHSSLLDPKDYPLPETSGAGLILYGMTWGINEGILDAAKYKPVVTKGWAGLLTNVYADGRLGNIQQTGAEPAFYLPGSSYNYGVGAYLLAGSELKRMVSGATQRIAPDTVANTDPAVYAKLHLPQPANPKLPDIILVGDSTVRNGQGDGAHNQMGWGDELAQFFDTTKINVVNRAIGGRSSRTYITEGHWGETLKLIKRGDVVLIQFGHNDSGPLDDTSRARGSISGVGDDSREIENPILKRHETVHTFGWYLRQYVRDIRAKGATPVLCSLVPRKHWKDGKIIRQTDTYRGWARAVAEQENIGFIDLNEIIARRYDSLGEAAVDPLFGDPNTHTTAAGATINAESVVMGLKALPHDPVKKYFSEKGKEVHAAKLD